MQEVRSSAPTYARGSRNLGRRGLDGSHQACANVLHGEAQLAGLRIEIEVQHEPLLHNLLIGIRVEGLIDLLAAVGHDLSSRRINGGIEDDVQMFAARCVFGREGGGGDEVSHPDLAGNGIRRWRLHLGGELYQCGGNDVPQRGGYFLLRVVAYGNKRLYARARRQSPVWMASDVLG